MDLMGGLHSLLGGETPGAKQQGEQRSGTSSRQGGELQRRNRNLKGKLLAARERIAELENQIDELKEESTKVEQNFDTSRGDMDQLITGVSAQIQEMIDTLDRRMEELQTISESTRQIDEIKSMVENLEQQKVSLEEINTKSEEIKEELVEKIHAENVACYRNMKSLVTELHENVNDMELSEESLMEIRKSFKGLKLLSVFSLLGFLILLFFLLMSFGVISF